MTAPRRVVIVGASAAGLAAAEGLRRAGYDGRLVLVGEERHYPYDRPPLSKQLLSGDWPAERLLLRPPEAYGDLDVEVRLGARARALDTAAREVELDGGHEPLAYDALVVATGVRARTLPGAEGVEGVHVLRTLDDAVALGDALARRPHLVIVGGGFIGAEAAAVAVGLGCEVTLVTDQAVPLADAVGADVGGMLTDLHREHGVRMETGALVEGVVTDGGRATGVRLTDGRTLPADAVLIGIGTRPNVEWLAGSGIPVGNGVQCDATLHAGRGVWAAGDVASWPDPVTGERLRIEHRTNASEQGLAVARNIIAGPEAATAFTSVPYVWSDQYDLKIQIHGRTRGADRMRMVEGSLEQRKFTALYARGAQVTAALGVNMVRPLRALRPLVADRADWESLTAPV
ncbi:NAD(P)/FAD-dependent oxidoreductase [Streptomyces sp. GQFP]|uniref:NAD(P)/FAD-dependent oxidoreductase n=1 Tax=Streptomyces sp. GQFP TaxID=2907545 RepID=UPI001F251B45|nr:FAD/NAD(P)-binding oxidoreductase [Streptomyces sp. GQFP]UIX29251.1 NAD(P)/FAD-dependent oxidoreductase [Streptomyces sp. GQFP]